MQFRPHLPSQPPELRRKRVSRDSPKREASGKKLIQQLLLRSRRRQQATASQHEIAQPHRLSDSGVFWETGGHVWQTWTGALQHREKGLVWAAMADAGQREWWRRLSIGACSFYVYVAASLWASAASKSLLTLKIIIIYCMYCCICQDYFLTPWIW